MTFTNQELAAEIVVAVLQDLTGRRGLRQEWEEIDLDVRDEIVGELREIVENKLTGAFSGV